MPPHLHPRSTATSTLFAGTLLASFIVVAIPHLAPCPRPHSRSQLNSEMKFDENGKPIRRARRTAPNTDSVQSVSASRTLQDEAAMFQQLQKEAAVMKAESKERECPVPKPGGLVGRWLGFEEGKKHVSSDV